eukprot:g3349.t1
MNVKRFLRAALAGDISVVRSCIEDDSNDICGNSSDKNGVTALHRASEGGHLETVQFLVEKANATIDLYTVDSGKTALHFASWNGNHDVVTFLCKCGARVNARNRSSWTPLLFAASLGHVRSCEALILAGADLHHCNKEKAGALYLSSRGGHYEVTKLLFEKVGRDLINMETVNRRTPLLCALMNGHLKVAAFLLDNGASVDAVDNSGKSIWHEVAWSGRTKDADFLVHRNLLLSDVCYDSMGRHPLHVACMENHIDLVRWFISNEEKWRWNDNPADSNITNLNDKFFQTPLYWASTEGASAIVEILLQHGSLPDGDSRQHFRSPLHSAAAWGHLSCVSLLLDAGADPNCLDSESKTVMEVAVANNQNRVVEHLQKCVKKNDRSHFFDSHCHILPYRRDVKETGESRSNSVVRFPSEFLEANMNTYHQEQIHSHLCIYSTSEEDWDIVENSVHSKGMNDMTNKVFIGYGIHPWQVHNNSIAEGWEDRLEERLLHNTQSLVGEIGLDFGVIRRKKSEGKRVQREVFEKQLEIATRLCRPTSVHCVKASGALIDCFNKFVNGALCKKSFNKTKRGIFDCGESVEDTSAKLPPSIAFHSCNLSPETIQSLLSLEKLSKKDKNFPFSTKFYFGFSHGQVLQRQNRNPAKPTKINAGRMRLFAAIKSVPEDRLLLESDYAVALVEGIGLRGRIDNSIRRICEEIAEARGWSFDETVAITRKNAFAFVSAGLEAGKNDKK